MDKTVNLKYVMDIINNSKPHKVNNETHVQVFRPKNYIWRANWR